MVDLNVSPLGWIGNVSDLAKTLVDKIFPPQADPNEKLRAQEAIEQAVQARENQIIDTQKSIMVAELQQGDNYTKRARPTIIYAGLGMIFLVHVAFPILAFYSGRAVPALTLPDQFWWAWGGACSIYIISRGAEKAKVGGVMGQLAGLITGNK
jgi:hypothetical protein